MLKTIVVAAIAALALGAGTGFAQEHEEEAAEAGHAGGHVEDHAFSFEGPFGRYDQAQLQRGLQVYTEVCSACHGLHYVPYRALAEEGGVAMTEEQMRAYAAMFEVEDPETSEFRPATPTDYFPSSTVENAPDLSLMAKARAGFHGPAGLGINQIINGMGGPEYIASMLLGFTGEEREEAGTVLYENTAFASGWMAMAPILQDDLVAYGDNTAATAEQMALDVSAFLMWAAEPKMMVRKSSGLTAVLFLAALATLLWLTNTKLWSRHKGKAP
jgi:ubiquinol-cytochrome c reductase cytochrome c1 subunit